MTEKDGTPENEGKDTSSQGAEKPRRRRQSAGGAVNRMTDIMSRDKEPEGSESSADEDPSASTSQEDVVEPGEDALEAASEITRQETEQSFERSPERWESGVEVRDEPASTATASGRGGRGRGTVAGAKEGRIRASVDLSRERHRFLKMFAVQNDSDGMSVLRELVGMLEEEEDIAPRLVRRLADTD